MSPGGTGEGKGRGPEGVLGSLGQLVHLVEDDDLEGHLEGRALGPGGRGGPPWEATLLSMGTLWAISLITSCTTDLGRA